MARKTTQSVLMFESTGRGVKEATACPHIYLVEKGIRTLPLV